MDETSLNTESQMIVAGSHGVETEKTTRETSNGEEAAEPEHADLETAIPSMDPAGFLKLSPVADMKRAVSTPIREPAKGELPPPVSEFKRAVSTPSRTPMDEAAALAAIKAIDALPKLPSRQRTDTQCSSCMKSLAKEHCTRPCTDCQCSSRDLPPLKENSPFRPGSMMKKWPEGESAVCCIPPLGDDAEPESLLVSNTAQIWLPQEVPAATVESRPLSGAGSKVVAEPQESAAAQPLSPATDKSPCQLVPWLHNNRGTESTAMKDTSVASTCSSVRRPTLSREKREEASGVWNPPDDRSEAPIPPRRQMSGDHHEDLSSYCRRSKERDPVDSDLLAQSREKLQPSTPATTISRRGRRRGLDKWQQRSVPDLQRALAVDLDESMDPRKDGTPKSPCRRLSTNDQLFPQSLRGFSKDQTSNDVLGFSSSMHTSVEIRKNGFVRRGRGGRANLSSSLSPGRHLGSSSHSPARRTLGSSHLRRSMRKVTSWDMGTTSTTKDTGLSTSLQHKGSNDPNTALATTHVTSKNNDSLRASRHKATHYSTRRPQQHEQHGDPTNSIRHSQEEVGKSAWSPTSSISLESASFGWDEISKEQGDPEGSELHDECIDDGLEGHKRPPVLYVQFKKEEKGTVYAASGHSGHKLGVTPCYGEAGSGTRTTTVEAEASLTWAYDLSTGTYKMVPMAPTSGMPWLCLCGQENEADFSFCGMCAQPKNWTCPHCQFSKNKSRFPHCGGCGGRRVEAMDPRPVRPTFLAPADPTSVY